MSNAPQRIEAPAATPQRTFLSRAEVARLFGVSASTVTRWARAGLVAAVRTPGGHYRFLAKDAFQAAAETGERKEGKS